MIKYQTLCLLLILFAQTKINLYTMIKFYDTKLTRQKRTLCSTITIAFVELVLLRYIVEIKTVTDWRRFL